MTLTDLASKYGCDKLHSHSYIPVYEELFRNRTIKRLLEIGIGYRDLMEPFVPHYVHGASLKMWEEYFPEAQIYACDIREDTLINEGRIKSMVCDQSSIDSIVELVAAFGPAFDVIVDDGSHRFEHQLLTAKILVPSQDMGSLYVIEDVQEPELLAHAISAAIHGPTVTVHRLHKRPDDNLVVIEL